MEDLTTAATSRKLSDKGPKPIRNPNALATTIVSRGGLVGKTANFKGRGYCLILSWSREHDRAQSISRWRR